MGERLTVLGVTIILTNLCREANLLLISNEANQFFVINPRLLFASSQLKPGLHENVAIVS